MHRWCYPVAGLVLAISLGGCGGEDGPNSRTSAPESTSASVSLGASPDEPELRLVAIGDSISYNSPDDCPGCTGFVDAFAKSVEDAHGEPVEVLNNSEHNGLTLEMLLDELDRFADDLASADVIVVGIAHNSLELSSDTPCGTPIDKNELPVWSVMTEQCARKSATKHRPMYDQLFATVADLRKGKPTLLRAVNRYNDWIGWPEEHFTPSVDRTTATFIRVWNKMLCASAESHGFGCADLSTAFNGPDGLRPSADLLADDYTHPSDKGNQVIAQVLTAMGTDLTPVA